MKRVVQKVSNNLITAVKDVSIDKYYGVEYAKTDWCVGFVGKGRKHTDEFYVHSAFDVTDGNYLIFNSYGNLTKLIEGLLNNHCEVYEFDKATELWAWLAEKTSTDKR